MTKGTRKEETVVNVAFYARVSDPKEKRGTIESQIEALQAYAQAHGHQVGASYVCRDRHTGTDLARPELDRLRDGAARLLLWRLEVHVLHILREHRA